MNIWFKRYVLVFFVSLFFSVIITPLVKKIATALKIMDHPNERKIHAKPIPLWGGVAVYIAYLFALITAFYYSNPLKIILTSGGIILLLGAWDDIRDIPAIVKFFALVTLTIWLSTEGIVIKLFNNLYPDIIVTIVWIVGMTSAFNAIDNMNGLAGGIAGICSLMFFIVAFQSEQWWFGLMSCALCGATAGFLPYNFKNAKVFLGNGGSMFLGFTLASIAVMGEWSKNRLIAYSIPLLILAIPIFDLAFVIFSRQITGVTKTFKEIISHSGKDHLSHRLVSFGLTQTQSVVLLYLLSFSLGLGAISLRTEIPIDTIILFVQALGIISIMILLLTAKRH